MNCWILLVLLFCGGNFRGTQMNNSNCSDGCSNMDNRYSGSCGCMTDRCENERNCGCQEYSNDIRDNDCGCRSEIKPEPRFEARPFGSYNSNCCGCEEVRNSNDCNCCQ